MLTWALKCCVWPEARYLPSLCPFLPGFCGLSSGSFSTSMLSSPFLCSWWPSGFAHCSVFPVSGMEWGCPSKVAVVPLAAWLYSSWVYHSGLLPLILCRVSLIGHQSANVPSESSISLDPISGGWWWCHVWGYNMATRRSEYVLEVSSWTLG